MLRIRKQFGILWYLFIIGIYLVEVPLFFCCLLVDKIINVGNTKYNWKNAVNYAVFPMVAVALAMIAWLLTHPRAAAQRS